jgi:hypothetical protein
MGIRKMITAASLNLLTLLLLAMPVGAGVSWCRADPIVELNGTEVQIWVAMDSGYEHLVDGPIKVTIFTPNKVDKKATFLDAGFNGYGEEVVFKHRGKMNDDGTIPVSVKVIVPINERQLRQEYGLSEVPILVEIIASDGQTLDVEGTNRGAVASLQVRGAE